MILINNSSELKIYKSRIIGLVKNLLDLLAYEFHRSPGNISLNFCSVSEIININNKYLKHNYPTDIITFDYSNEKIISGEIFICPDVVSTNANRFKQDIKEEHKRVLIHGLLHMIGFNDKTTKERKLMKEMEDRFLSVSRETNILRQ